MLLYCFNLQRYKKNITCNFSLNFKKKIRKKFVIPIFFHIFAVIILIINNNTYCYNTIEYTIIFYINQFFLPCLSIYKKCYSSWRYVCHG